MKKTIERRDFIHLTAVGSALYFITPGFINTPDLSETFGIMGYNTNPKDSKIISPGCRGTKVKVARLFMGNTVGLWPKPDLNLEDEIEFYKSRFAELGDELSDVEFVVDELVSTPEEVVSIKDKLSGVDGILVHSSHPGNIICS